ncbi:uncharacterized protein LOC144442022 [Glandiceps talaboti]
MAAPMLCSLGNNTTLCHHEMMAFREVFLVLCTVAAIFVDRTFAVDADLTISGFTISSPNPDVTSVVYTTDTNVNVVLSTFNVVNNGPDALTTEVSNQYDVKMYLSDGDSLVDPQEVTTFSFADGSNLRYGPLNSGASSFYLAQNFDLNYPSNLCSTHSHVCLKVEQETNTYTESDSTNDYQCLPFIKGSGGSAVGYTSCDSDPVPIEVNVTTPTVFTYDEETNVTLDIMIDNQGGAPVDGSTSTEDNIAFSSVFIANSQSTSASKKIDLTDSLSYTYSDVSANIDPWSDTTYTGIKVSITIPDLSCRSYSYLCIVFAPGINATFGDTSSNNLICGEFGTSSIGDVVCPEATTLMPATTMLPPTPDTGEVGGSDSSMVNIHVGAIVGITFAALIVGAVAALLILYTAKKCIKAKQNKKNAVTAIDVNEMKEPQTKGAWEARDETRSCFR